MNRNRSLLLFAILLGGLAARPSRAQSTLTCASDDGKRHYCNTDTSRGISLTRQLSGSPCTQGSTWGYDNNRVWVDRGCRAEFSAGGRAAWRGGTGFNGANGGGGGNAQSIRCESGDEHRHTCPADTSGGVRLVNQLSGSPCQQGRGWGYDAGGIWVDRGCRADFEVGGNAFGNRRNWNNRGANAQTMECSSDDGKRHYCNADTSRGVSMTRQISGSPCTQGSTWGYDNRGIWVDRGCRADFQIGR